MMAHAPAAELASRTQDSLTGSCKEVERALREEIKGALDVRGITTAPTVVALAGPDTPVPVAVRAAEAA